MFWAGLMLGRIMLVVDFLLASRASNQADTTGFNTCEIRIPFRLSGIGSRERSATRPQTSGIRVMPVLLSTFVQAVCLCLCVCVLPQPW